MKRLSNAFILMLLSCYTSLASQTGETFRNPMIYADVPDMSVVRVDDSYYMISTTMHLTPGGPIMKSNDLVHWETVGYVFDKLTDNPKYDLLGGTVYGRGQWASSIRYHNGRFYVLFSPNDEPYKAYLYTAENPAGKWELVSRMEHFHDASLFFDDDGKVYVFYGTGELQELKSDLSGVKPDGVNRKLFERDAEEYGLLEGSQAIKHNGKYYLLMISMVWDKPGRVRRQVCYRADNITGPYEKKVILEHDFDGYGGVGQGCIVDSKEGDWYGIIFQDRGGVGRVPMLMPCRWIDGWPILGDEKGQVPQTMTMTTYPAKNRNGILGSDDFDSKSLSLYWQWNHNPENDKWSLTERPGYLRLKTGRIVDNIYLAPNTITQRMGEPACKAVISMDVSNMKEGDVAGFSAFNGHSGLLSVVKDGTVKRLMMSTNIVHFTEKDKAVAHVDVEEKAQIEFTQNVIYLRIDCDFTPNRDIATFYYSLDNKSWEKLGTDFKMQFDYTRLFMGSRFAIFNYATQTPGGYVDIDFFAYSQQSTARLQKQGTATQLIVDNKPFLVLGGELGNSSASSVEDIERIFPKLQRMGLNTVLVPAYWDLIEPVEGTYDFTLIDQAIRQARENQLKIIFLWFGAWKNSMSCYAPLWFKEDYKKYPRVHTRTGKPLEIASSFSENVYQADNRAFSKLMKRIAAIDKEEGTVVMVQIENEIGMLEDARDYSADTNEQFYAPVPQTLTDYLQKNKQTLHPQMLEKWEAQGCPTKGNWQEVFGADIYTDEIFMAWHYALYVERMAQAARSIHDIPLYVNAAMNSRGRKPGQYPSAGPLAHLIDIWHCGAPSIDLLAPDLYDNGFTDWVTQYNLHNNPLFIPEIRLADNDGVRAFYVFGEHDAIGFSPFSIEDASDDPQSLLIQSYAKLNELMPLLTFYQGKGVMNGLLFDEQNKERILYQDDLKIICRHYFTLPWDPRATNGSVWPEGGGILLKLNKNEYLIAGSGIVIEFEHQNEKKAPSAQALGEDGFTLNGENKYPEQAGKWNGLRAGIGSVDEVSINADGSFRYIRRLNGDQDHQGRHIRIPTGQFSILHVKLYEYN